MKVQVKLSRRNGKSLWALDQLMILNSGIDAGARLRAYEQKGDYCYAIYKERGKKSPLDVQALYANLTRMGYCIASSGIAYDGKSLERMQNNKEFSDLWQTIKKEEELRQK